MRNIGIAYEKAPEKKTEEAPEKDEEKKPAPGDGPRAKLRLDIKRVGASDEIGLLDKLETKLQEDFGRR